MWALVLLLGFAVLPFLLGASAARPAWSAFVPALAACAIALYADATEPAEYDMPGFGLAFYLLVAAIAAGCALAGLVVRLLRARGRRG
ncbi:MAG TPA: hypothetical protein VD931_06105 [Baekduia sp.]|nr:hypothetical protein [Baekduia sp.]